MNHPVDRRAVTDAHSFDRQRSAVAEIHLHRTVGQVASGVPCGEDVRQRGGVIARTEGEVNGQPSSGLTAGNCRDRRLVDSNGDVLGCPKRRRARLDRGAQHPRDLVPRLRDSQRIRCWCRSSRRQDRGSVPDRGCGHLGEPVDIVVSPRDDHERPREDHTTHEAGCQPLNGSPPDGDGDDERKLILNDFTISLNSGKWERPENILNNWRVTKTCLRLGRRIVGKCLMGSTCNALDKGGGNFKKLFEDSEPTQRNANGQTKSGLYSLFVPMEWNFEGYIDKYGWPVFHKPTTTVEDSYGDPIDSGVIDYWENEVLSLKGDADALNEFYRQFPRTTSHAFRDESKSSIFNLTKIYHQIDYNDNLIKDRVLTRGSFHWKDGVKDGEVVWTPERTGRFTISWMPPMHLRNRKTSKGGIHYPGNEHLGSFGCDPYDISSTTDGRGSKGSLHGLTKFNMDDAPSNEFFLEYIARPQTAEIFFEDVLMACVFYGMPILAENNKPRLLYFLKNRGYRRYSINRPDKLKNRLSRTEKELGGIPNTSEDIKQAHAAAIESYIEKHVGLDLEGTYRDPDEMGSMFFNRTLEDWAKFDINNRTKYDASISSGLALMACNKNLYKPVQERTTKSIDLGIKKYDNQGVRSQII